MRNEPILQSIQRMAEVEPGFWRDIQKNLNKYNEATGSRFNMFDMLSDSGKSPVHINAREDAALGNVPDMPFKGTGQDDRIASLTPFQQAILKARGGSGAVNPQTGLREYDGGGGDGSGGDGGDGGDGGGNWSDSGDSGGNWTWGDGSDAGFSDGTGSYNWNEGGFGGSGAFGGNSSGDGGYNWGGEDDGSNAGLGGGRGPMDGTMHGGPGDEPWNDPGRDKDENVTGSGKDPDATDKMGLSPRSNPEKSLLDSIKESLADFKFKLGPDPMGLRDPSNEAHKNTFSAVGGLGVGTFAGFMGNLSDWAKDQMSQDMFDKGYKDLDSLERDSVDNAWKDSQGKDSQDAGSDRGFGDMVPKQPISIGGPTLGPNNFMSAERPSSWADYFGSDIEGMTPDQIRTGAATHALFGPGAVFRTPESMDYWRRLATETLSGLNPPEDVDMQFLTNVLGRAQPADPTVEAFLNALRY